MSENELWIADILFENGTLTLSCESPNVTLTQVRVIMPDGTEHIFKKVD